MKALLTLIIPILLVSCREPTVVEAAKQPRISKEKRVEIDQALSEQVMGKELAGRISLLGKKGFEKGALGSAPEFYLLYFSASW